LGKLDLYDEARLTSGCQPKAGSPDTEDTMNANLNWYLEAAARAERYMRQADAAAAAQPSAAQIERINRLAAVQQREGKRLDQLEAACARSMPRHLLAPAYLIRPL
jgi:hypothetical protein